jgi:hypothetical protein
MGAEKFNAVLAPGEIEVAPPPPPLGCFSKPAAAAAATALMGLLY